MLGCLSAIVPGIVAAICAWIWNRESFQLKKFVMRFFSWGLVINAILWQILFLMGNYDFNLFAMGTSFKIKWMILGIGLAGCFTYAYKNIKRLSKENTIDIMKRCFPETLFLIITYAIFVPSSLFLGNRGEFLINYTDILPMLIIMAILIYLLINLVGLSIPNKKILGHYIALIFSGTMGLYLQGNFLNPKFPALDGAEINWSDYTEYGILSLSIWILTIIAAQVVVFLWKQKAETILKYVSYFLAAVQLVTLVVLLITSPKTKALGFSKEGEFTVGTEENILVFVVDSLETETLQAYIKADIYDDSWMENFTFFENVVAGGAPTQNAMPVLLTGAEFDPTWTEGDEYTTEAWEDAILYDDLKEAGYDVRFFSDIELAVGMNKPDLVENITEASKLHITDPIKFARTLYQLVDFYTVPQFLKQRYWMSTDKILKLIETPEEIYALDDIQFKQDFENAGKIQSTDYKKALRLYHLEGAHVPFERNENMEFMGKDMVTEQQQLEGVLRIIQDYMDELKKAGLYDDSTIIILGDHGQHEEYNLEANPAVLIKRVNEKHDLQINSVPLHFRNVYATIAEAFLEDYTSYGPSVYDITEDSDVERFHTVMAHVRGRAFPEDTSAYEKNHTRYVIPINALDVQNYKIFNPREINRFSYNLGEIIDFTENNSYAEQMNYRLYKENNTAIASNELYFCLNLENYQKGDVTFNFTCADIYNASQRVKVYAKGQKVADITCTKDGVGKENSTVIPEECIEDGVLPIRMVFPNAVTPNQLDRSDSDTRVLSVAFSSMEFESMEKEK